jgi:hypothetical protein
MFKPEAKYNSAENTKAEGIIINNPDVKILDCISGFSLYSEINLTTDLNSPIVEIIDSNIYQVNAWTKTPNSPTPTIFNSIMFCIMAPNTLMNIATPVNMESFTNFF